MILSLAFNTMFTEYGKVLVLNFSKMGNTTFYWSQKLMSDDIFPNMEYHVHWFLECFCFKLFGDEKFGLFLIKIDDWKMIFTGYVWAFYDILGLWKYSFWCSRWSKNGLNLFMGSNEQKWLKSNQGRLEVFS